MKIFKLCKFYILEHKIYFCTYIIINIIVSILGILAPLVTGKFIDNLTGNMDKSILMYCCIAFAVLNFLIIIISYVSNIIYVKLQITAGFNLNFDIIKNLKKIQRLLKK